MTDNVRAIPHPTTEKAELLEATLDILSAALACVPDAALRAPMEAQHKQLEARVAAYRERANRLAGAQ